MKFRSCIKYLCALTFFAQVNSLYGVESKVSAIENAIMYIDKNKTSCRLIVSLVRDETTYYKIPNEVEIILSLKNDENREIKEALSIRLAKLPDWQARLSLEFHLLEIMNHGGVLISRSASSSLYSVKLQ